MSVAPKEKHGARVFLLADGVYLVKQTVKSGGRYVIDGHKEAHVDPGSYSALGEAVAQACTGGLKAGRDTRGKV